MASLSYLIHPFSWQTKDSVEERKNMATINKRLTKDQIEELAEKVYQLFRKNGIWSDTIIYFNGCSLDNKDETGRYHYDGSAYHHKDKDPRDYFGYVNSDHILSMSFEGPVNHMFNYGEYQDVLDEFNALLDGYGLYYELGNSWNLSCYYTWM